MNLGVIINFLLHHHLLCNRLLVLHYSLLYARILIDPLLLSPCRLPVVLLEPLLCGVCCIYLSLKVVHRCQIHLVFCDAHQVFSIHSLERQASTILILSL